MTFAKAALTAFNKGKNQIEGVAEAHYLQALVISKQIEAEFKKIKKQYLTNSHPSKA